MEIQKQTIQYLYNLDLLQDHSNVLNLDDNICNILANNRLLSLITDNKPNNYYFINILKLYSDDLISFISIDLKHWQIHIRKSASYILHIILYYIKDIYYNNIVTILLKNIVDEDEIIQENTYYSIRLLSYYQQQHEQEQELKKDKLLLDNQTNVSSLLKYILKGCDIKESLANIICLWQWIKGIKVHKLIDYQYIMTFLSNSINNTISIDKISVIYYINELLKQINISFNLYLSNDSFFYICFIISYMSISKQSYQ